MARKKDSPIGVGMTAKQMKRKRPINADLLNKIEPITDNQKTLFENCLLYTSPSPRDGLLSRMPSSA